MPERSPLPPAEGAADVGALPVDAAAPSKPRRGVPAIDWRGRSMAVHSDPALVAMCRHALAFDLGDRPAKMRAVVAGRTVVSFSEVVAALGSFAAARFAVLQLAGTGELVVLVSGVSRDARVPAAAGGDPI